MYYASAMFRSGPARFALALGVIFALYQSAEGIGGNILGSMAAQGGFLVACLFAAWAMGWRVLRDGGWRAYALDAREGAPAWFLACFVLALGVKGAALAAGSLAGVYSLAPLPCLAPHALIGGFAFAALATFLPSIAEDILTRGLWWRQVGEALSPVTFVALSAVVYVLNHIFRLANGPAEWAMLACFGVAYAVALVKSGTLWAAVGLHWGWNLANAALDVVAQVEGDPAVTPYLSGAAHLAMALAVLALARRLSPTRPSEPIPPAEPARR